MFLLKLAIRSWKLNLIGQIFSVFAFSFLLVLSGFLYWLHSGIEKTVDRTKEENVVVAYLSPKVKERETKLIIDQIQTSMSAPKRKKIQSFTTADFLKDIELSYPELREQLVGLGDEVQRVVPRYLLISGVFQEGEIQAIKRLKGVESIETSEHRFRGLATTFQVIRWVIFAIGIGLLIALLGATIQNSRLNSASNQKVVPLLKQWGAGNFYVRAPSFLSGVIFGAASGVGALILWVLFSRSVGYQVTTFSHLFSDIALPSLQIGLSLVLVSIFLGVLSGFGSLVKVKNEK